MNPKRSSVFSASADKQTCFVAIHQPNFLPWMGYFLKMAAADKFVFHDQVSLNVRGYTRRTLVSAGSSPDKGRWLTIPLKRYPDGTRIRDLQMSFDHPWTKKHLFLLKNNYYQFPYFHEVMPMLEEAYGHVNELSGLSEWNIFLIKQICRELDIQVTFFCSSAANVSGSPSAVNAALVQWVGGSHYISGKGSEKYESVSEFDNIGVKRLASNALSFLNARLNLESQDAHIGWSVIDLWMRYGTEWMKHLIVDWKNELRQNLS